SWPRCSLRSAARPRSSPALTISGRNPPSPVSASSPASTRSISSSSSPASSMSLIVCRAERGSGASVTPSGCLWSVGMRPCYSSTLVQVLHRPSDNSGQREIPDKKGEADQVEALLAPLDTAGMVFTLDALHTTRKTARLITDDLDAHYLLIVKGNQPLALAATATVLTGPDADWAATSAVEDDRGHGRTERRQIR